MNLNRYVHYYNRQKNHEESINLEHKLRATVKEKAQVSLTVLFGL